MTHAVSICLVSAAALMIAASAAQADNAGGRSGAPVPTGQNPVFSQPLNQPIPPARSTTQPYYSTYPSYQQQPRRPATRPMYPQR